VYIGATVFGVGITLIDLFGLLGSHDGDHAGEDSGGHVEDGALAEGSGALGDHDEGSEPADDDAAPGEAHDSEALEHDGSLAGHDRPERRSPVLGILSFLRNIIYFCLGFGPVGWFAVATGNSLLTSLLWSAPIGVGALFGTRALRKFMRRELDSAVKSSELLMEKGEVTVSIGAGELGRVRIKLGEIYVDRFARAATPQTAIHVGTQVRVTDVGDDCVYVEAE
jgi:membrane protein implicated in regulation of membrane protease activity